jgi:hypothetical protein
MQDSNPAELANILAVHAASIISLNLTFSAVPLGKLSVASYTTKLI